MSAADNKALVRQFLEHGYLEAAGGNLDVVHQYYADHYQDHTPLHDEQPGVEGLKVFIADIGQASPDMRLKVDQMAADGDLVFAHWRATGTHQQQYQVTKHVRDLKPTGEQGTMAGISLFRIEGGKFVEGWTYHNVAEFAMAQSQGGASGGRA